MQWLGSFHLFKIIESSAQSNHQWKVKGPISHGTISPDASLYLKATKVLNHSCSERHPIDGAPAEIPQILKLSNYCVTLDLSSKGKYSVNGRAAGQRLETQKI